MKVRSLKSNFVLNALRIVSSAMIGIALMPYINRVLGVTLIGKVEYVLSIVNYFILFSAMGIPIYGIREIARVRDDIHEKTKVFLELLLILIITTVISYTVLFGLFLQLDFFSGYKVLILILGSLILLTNLGTEWYFQGMENQLFITVRTVVVRLVGFLLIIFYIKGPEDELGYAAIMLFILGGANVFNIFYVYKTLDLSSQRLQDLNLKRHMKPILTVFFAAISINIYLHLDKILLGTIKNSDSVAYYTVANKIVRFVIELITVIGMVMLPRLSKLFHSDIHLYKKYILKAFYVIVIIATPFSIYLSIYAPQIINIMGGQLFSPSVTAMRILAPLCLVVGIAYYLGYLILYTQNREKIYTTAVVISAIFSVLINYQAIKHYDFLGAAAVAVLSEILAIIIMLVLINNSVVNIRIWTNNLLKIVVANLILLILFGTFIILMPTSFKLTDFIIGTGVFFVFYFVLLFVFNEETVIEHSENLLKIINRGK